jgi:hypothetical protein
MLLTLITMCAAATLASTITIAVTNGGTLTFTVSNPTTSNCFVNGSLANYTQYNFTNFSYTDASGVQTAFSGANAIYYSSPGGTSCPPNGAMPNPLALNGSGFTVNFVATQGSGSATFISSGASGFVSPKYEVLSVFYVPPGAKSFVDYGTSTNSGTSMSLMGKNQFSSTLTVTVGKTIGGVASMEGVNVASLKLVTSNSVSTTDTYEQDTSSSVAVNKTSTSDLNFPGPTSNSVGLDHDFDVIKIWLNPVLSFSAPTAGTLVWNGIFWDSSDPVMNSDIIYLTVGELKNPSLIPQAQLNQLMREWAPNMADGSGPGLTSADLLDIAKADPFSNGTYSPSILSGQTCTSDGRYCQVTADAPIQYASPAQGGGGLTTKYTEGYTTTATQGQGATDTHQTAFTVDDAVSGGFLSTWTIDIKKMTSMAITNQWSTATSHATGQNVTVSVTEPANSDGYTGNSVFDVYQDNVYGTLMFLPVAFPGFTLSGTPGSVTTTPGGKVTYTINAAIVDGGTGTVTFSTSGLPTAATASFSPATVTVGGSSTLTVQTAGTIAPGSYPFSVSATTGSIPHVIGLTLIVNAAPDFSLTASPSSQTVTVGKSTTYTLTATALNGFAGTIGLGATGAPAGTTIAISPTSIVNSGTATVTVTTSTSTPVGGFTIMLTGTSGTKSHTANITLVTQAATKDFSIAITPIDSGIAAGSSATYTVTITPINGFTGTVGLALAGLPSNSTATYSPTSIVNSGSSTLTVKTATNTPLGNYTLTATGTSGTLRHSVSATLTVNAP